MSKILNFYQKISKTKLALALACALLITACSDNQQDLSAQSEQHIKQALAYSQQGQFRPAMIEARNAIQKAPKNAQGHIVFANILLELNQGKQALIQLDQVPENERQNLDYILAKANVLISRGKFQSAIDLLSSPLSANDLEASLLKAKSYHALNELDESIALYKTLPEDNVRVRLGLARAYAQKSDFHSAFMLLDQLKKDTPSNPEVLLFEASLAIKDGDLEKTEALLTEALSQLPNTDIMTPMKANIMRGLANVLVQQGRSSEALIYTKILAEAYPGADIAQAKYKEAVALFQESKLDDAKASLLKLLEDYPQFEQGAQLVGIISYLQGDFESASTYFNDNLDPETASELATNIAASASLRLNDPDKVLELLRGKIDKTSNPETLALYGLAAIAAGKSDEAESVLLRSLQGNDKNGRLRLVLAEHYNKKNDQAEALEQLQLAIKTGENDPLVQAQLAKQLINMNQQVEAEKFLNQLIKNHENEYTSYLVAGDTAFYTKNYSKAQNFYKKALALSPNHPSALAGLGFSSSATENWDEAVQAFENLITASPNKITGYRGLLQSYEAQNRSEEALDLLNTKAASFDSIQPYLAIAEYYTRQQNFDAANQKLVEAKTRSPSNTQINSAIAQVAYYQAVDSLNRKNPSAAKAAALKGLQEKANEQRLLIVLIESEIKLGNYSDARELARQFENNANHLYQLMLAEVDMAQEKPTSALSHYENSWQTKPADLTARKIYALKRSEQGSSQANNFVSEWLTKTPNSPIALSLDADQKLQAEDYPAAILQLEKVNKLAPNSPIILNNLAWAYFKTGNKNAIATAQKAAELAPDNAAVIDTYGWILVNSKQIQKGIELLEKASQLNPDIQDIQDHLAKAKSML